MRKRFPIIVQELLLLMVLYGLLAEVVVLAAVKDRFFYSVGLIVGVVLAMGMCIHMQISLEDAIDMGEAGAQKHISKTYGFRTAAVFLIMGIMYYFKIGSIITGFIGIMSLKVAAYLQPFTHKCLKKYVGKGR
jgi:hypothetical protein